MKTIFYSLIAISTIPFIIGCATIANDKATEKLVTIKEQDDIRTSLYQTENKYITSEVSMKNSMLGAMESCAEEKKYALMDKPTEKKNGHLTAFVCKENINSIGHFESTEKVSRELVSPITKDLAGGILVRTIDQKDENSFKDKDILLTLNNKRIENMAQFSNARDSLAPGKTKVKILRNSKEKEIEIDVTAQTQAIHDAEVVLFELSCSHKDRKTVEFTLASIQKACDTVHSFLKDQENNLVRQ